MALGSTTNAKVSFWSCIDQNYKRFGQKLFLRLWDHYVFSDVPGYNGHVAPRLGSLRINDVVPHCGYSSFKTEHNFSIKGLELVSLEKNGLHSKGDNPCSFHR